VAVGVDIFNLIRNLDAAILFSVVQSRVQNELKFS